MKGALEDEKDPHMDEQLKKLNSHMRKNDNTSNT